MTKSPYAGGLVVALAIGATVSGAGSATAAPRVAGKVTVLAASSLTEAFTRIGQDFEDKYRGTRVVLSFNASSTLVTQIEQGVPADVFAAADTATMQRLVSTGTVQEPGGVPFARNRLEIAVEPGNPKRIKTLADTLKPNVTLVLCAPEVPCGKFARQAYRKAKLELPEVPTGANVKDTLSKVTLGEADAAIVYVTDVKAADGEVRGVELPSAQNVTATSPIALLAGRPNPVAAKAFVQYVNSRAGQRTLRRFGFRPPP